MCVRELASDIIQKRRIGIKTTSYFISQAARPITAINTVQNGWRYTLGDNGAPMGNGYLGIKWSRDRRRHVTQKGQGRDRNMIRAQYRENDWRYRLIGCNRVPA